ncbi:MAG: UDP-N-acetylmuramoyl-L-alanine--D-glutamate ligase, partial [Gammaproteobacteria bacterium]
MAAQVSARNLPEPGYDLVVGLGTTGFSCARHLAAAGRRVVVCDSREQPPGRERLAMELPSVTCFAGPFAPELFRAAGRVILSPGLDPDLPAVTAAREAGIEIIGDIELFARLADAPVVAVTGSNGKSTVTTLVAEMAASAGRRVRAGGNLGPAALDLLEEEAPDLYVLELSSFQLDLCRSLRPVAAVVLNVSPDHLD